MKPLTLEEAKANIGKEVVYIGEHMNAKKDFARHKPIIVAVSPIPNYNPVHVSMGGNVHHTWAVEAKDIALKQTLKIGDTVKLDPSTKPYTFINLNGDIENKLEQNLSEEVAKVTYIYNSGDTGTDSYGCIHQRHLIKVEEETMTVDQLIERNTVEDATRIGVKSKLFSIVLDETRFLWINNQWIECHSIDDDFEPVTIGIDTGEDKVEHKPQYSEEEIELRERIAMELLRQRNRHPNDIDLWFKSITGK